MTPRATWMLIALIGCEGASAQPPASQKEQSCVEYRGRLEAPPASHSKDVQPPSVVELDYPDLGATTPAHYPWPMRLDVLVDAAGKVRRVCTSHEDGEEVLATFGAAFARSTFRPARLRGQPVAFEMPMTIHLPELEKALK